MTGVCRICGHSFSSWSGSETICPNCMFSEDLHKSLNNYDSTHLPAALGSSYYCLTDSINTVSANNNDLPILIIKAQKIVLENGGVQLVVDNDTIKNIDSIEVNGIKFVREDN